MTNKKYTRTQRMLMSISSLLIISSTLIIALIILQTQKITKSASKFQLDQTLQKVNNEFNAYFAPLRNVLILLAEWGKTGLLEDREPVNLVAKLHPILDKFDHIEYITIASQDGYFLSLNKENDLIRTKKINFHTDTVWITELWNEKLVRVDFGEDELKQSTKANLSEIFSKPYIEDTIINSPIRYFFETLDMGINYGIYFQSRVSDKRFRVSLGVLLSDIAEWIDSQQIGTMGRVILFDMKGRIFSPVKTDMDTEEIADTLYLIELDSTAQKLEFEAITKWKNLSGDEQERYRIRYNNEYWWAGISSVNKNRPGLKLGVIVPEKDLLDYMEGRKGFLIIGFLIIFIGSVATFLIIVFRPAEKNANILNHPWERTNEASLLKMIREGESDKLEFKSTVRHNLHTGKPGKEIELAWLKGLAAFLNSEGGTLLIGVNDQGEIIGLDADNFANDDRCLLHMQNLIKQHIGLEFSRYIAIELLNLRQGKVMIIYASPSKEPVFLRQNDKEQFFVRSGPSSVELPVSKALKYIEDRKKS